MGRIDESTSQIWWVFHGYVQLAQFFIQKFQCLTEQEIYIIAPEGLSRFYPDGNSGRVGATWMTRENRLMDIENYIQYLETILKIEPGADIQITLFGFSQGAATASQLAVGELGCGRAKLNVLQIVWSVLCVGFAALLILRRVGCLFATAYWVMFNRRIKNIYFQRAGLPGTQSLCLSSCGSRRV